VDGDRGFLNGRSNRSNHSWVVCMDADTTPHKIHILRRKDRISADAGVRCGLGVILDFDVCVI